MHSLPLFGLLFFFLIINCCSGANLGRMPQSQLAPGKAYYNIFPTPDTNYNDTASFIATIVGTDDLKPCTDVQGNLMSWTVEADDSQVAQSSNHPGIERVTKLDLPTAQTTMTTTSPPGNTSSALARRQDVVQNWIVVPTDSNNTAQVNQTGQFLASLTNTEPEQHFQGP